MNAADSPRTEGRFIMRVSSPPDASTRAFTLPEVEGLSSTYFVSLRLESAGEHVSRNFYWLSTRPETLDWARSDRDESGQYQISTWTPTKTFADYTALATLRDVIGQHKGQRFGVGEFKDWTGISRKYAIPLLEMLDREIPLVCDEWATVRRADDTQVSPQPRLLSDGQNGIDVVIDISDCAPGLASDDHRQRNEPAD